MKAMVMAAGLGTRLRPWTLEHPKALVPVEGVPVLERLIYRLRDEGFDRIVVNVHHFAGQVTEFLRSRDFGVRIDISDESDRLLDTGGALVKAAPLLCGDGDGEPVLVHNVDILSDCPLRGLAAAHMESGSDVTLLTSPRESSRHLVFDAADRLAGWHNVATGEYRPAGFRPGAGMSEEAFSGIYMLGCGALDAMARYAARTGDQKFPVMDFFLSRPEGVEIRRRSLPGLRLLDIGKPDALKRASGFLSGVGQP